MIQLNQQALSHIEYLQLKGLRLGQLFTIVVQQCQQQGVDPFHAQDQLITSILQNIVDNTTPKEPTDGSEITDISGE